MLLLAGTLPESLPRVLVVEDDPVQGKILVAIVQQLGLCPVGPATSAAAALGLAGPAWPALAIIDVHLAGPIDGIDLATQLLQLHELPVIFISADKDVAADTRLLPVQPLALLRKPFAPQALQQLITQWLAQQSGLLAPPVLPGSGAGPTPNNWLFLRERNLLVRVAAADIVCIHLSQQHATFTLVSGRRYSVRVSLAALLRYLPPPDFVQCHRQWVVNQRHIEQLDFGTDSIKLAGGLEAVLGRTYRQRVAQQLCIIG